MNAEKRITSRPQCFSGFVGQEKIKKNLKIFIKAAQKRDENIDHILFAGPPGLGKTTLAHIISYEMKKNFRATSAPILTHAGDLAGLLTNLENQDILFIDEIHRLNPAVEEMLYTAMEDFKLDIIIGEGPAAQSMRIDINPFTLIGATTRTGLLSTPLRDRFGIPIRLNFYQQNELAQIITQNAQIMNVQITQKGADEIAKRARGTPRVATRLLRRIRDFAHANGNNTINHENADEALKELQVDQKGLDTLDQNYLNIIAQQFNGGPVGVETIAASLIETRDTIEDVIEPYLIRIGFLHRTNRGRVITHAAFNHLNISPPKNIKQENLFDQTSQE